MFFPADANVVDDGAPAVRCRKFRRSGVDTSARHAQAPPAVLNGVLVFRDLAAQAGGASGAIIDFSAGSARRRRTPLAGLGLVGRAAAGCGRRNCPQPHAVCAAGASIKVLRVGAALPIGAARDAASGDRLCCRRPGQLCDHRRRADRPARSGRGDRLGISIAIADLRDPHDLPSVCGRPQSLRRVLVSAAAWPGSEAISRCGRAMRDHFSRARWRRSSPPHAPRRSWQRPWVMRSRSLGTYRLRSLKRSDWDWLFPTWSIAFSPRARRLLPSPASGCSG